MFSIKENDDVTSHTQVDKNIMNPCLPSSNMYFHVILHFKKRSNIAFLYPDYLENDF